MMERKAWGEVEHVFLNSFAAISELRTLSRTRCSMHRHMHRDNFFWVRSGKVVIEECPQADINDGRLLLIQPESYVLGPGCHHVVRAKRWHRFRVIEGGIMVEMYYPHEVGDVVRFDDIERLDVGGDDA